MFVVENMLFYALKLILYASTKTIFEISKDHFKEQHVQLPDVKRCFQKLVEFSYSEKKSQIKNFPVAEELMVVTYGFDCVDLKLHLEPEISCKFLRADYVVTIIIFSDTPSCSLLKEIIMSMIVLNLDSAMVWEGWSKAKKSLHIVTYLFEYLVFKRL